MNSRRRLSWLVVFAGWIALAQPDACLAADTLKIGNAGALPGGLARVPVFIRDASGTALNRDGTPIQSIRFRVIFTHPELIEGCKTTQFPDCEMTFIPGGVLAGLTPSAQNITTGATSMVVQYAYDQTTAPIPFHLDQAAPGDSIGFIEARISASASLGEEIDFTVDVTAEATALSNASGTISETFNAGLLIFGGTIKVSECTTAPTSENVAMNWSSDGCAAGSNCTLGANVAFHASGVGDYTLQSCDVVTWDFGDGASESGQSTTHKFTTAGVHPVVMTVTNPSGTTTITQVFVIKPAIEPCRVTPIVPAKAVTSAPIEFAVAFTNCVPLEYRWEFGDGSRLTTLSPASHTYAAAGIYQWSLAVITEDDQYDFDGTITVLQDVKRRAVRK